MIKTHESWQLTNLCWQQRNYSKIYFRVGDIVAERKNLDTFGLIVGFDLLPDYGRGELVVLWSKYS